MTRIVFASGCTMRALAGRPSLETSVTRNPESAGARGWFTPRRKTSATAKKRSSAATIPTAARRGARSSSRGRIARHGSRDGGRRCPMERRISFSSSDIRTPFCCRFHVAGGPKRLSNPGELHAHGGRRYAEHGGDLRRVEVFAEVEVRDRALAPRERPEPAVERIGGGRRRRRREGREK